LLYHPSKAQNFLWAQVLTIDKHLSDQLAKMPSDASKANHPPLATNSFNYIVRKLTNKLKVM